MKYAEKPLAFNLFRVNELRAKLKCTLIKVMVRVAFNKSAMVGLRDIGLDSAEPCGLNLFLQA